MNTPKEQICQRTQAKVTTFGPGPMHDAVLVELPPGADPDQAIEELLTLPSNSLGRHEDCDCMCCRPWTT